jgi:pimeloyl-ACP methyl ester carboxylesterase
VSEHVDEFSFLPEQAADAGLSVALPRGERLRMSLADGRTLSALRYAAGEHDAPAVTFLHGAGLNAHTWDTTVLATGLPALAIDLPGHGDSSWRTDLAYVARALAVDVIAGMDAWTTQPQVLVGQSLGGLTAAAVAAARPDLVREVMIVDITPGVEASEGPAMLREFFSGPTDWASRDELVDRAMAFGLGGNSRRKAARGVFFNSRVRDDGRVEWKHHFARLAAAPARPANATPDPSVAAALTTTGWDDLAAVTAPITLVRGERGFVTPANVDEFAARVPAASVIALPSGHNVQEEMPRELADLVRARAQAH